MLDKQGYSNYLIKKKSSDKLTEERLGLLDRFNTIITQNGITSIEDIGEAEIAELIRPWDVSGRRNFLHNIHKFINDYVAFIKKENPSQAPLGDFIEDYYKKGFEAQAKSAAAKRRAAVLPAPEEYKVNPQFLGEMDNDQFVNAFKELQQFVIRCYDDIQRTPFEWGYPEYETTDGYYNRVIDILFAIGLCGTYADGGITVDGTMFFANSIVKRHKKVERMISMFGQMGFSFDGFGKKTPSFRVLYPDNPYVVAVLCTYVSVLGEKMAEWAWGMPMNSLSYRLIQDPVTQQYHRIFHAQMDYASGKLKEIQEWLYAEAEKYGYSIDPENSGILYKKGSKRFMQVRQGHHEPGTGHLKHHETKIATKVSFIHAFERDPKGMAALVDRFPHVFRMEDAGEAKCAGCGGLDSKCTFRMNFKVSGVQYMRCGLENFFFDDITFDDVKAILEMFKIENKIKLEATK